MVTALFISLYGQRSYPAEDFAGVDTPPIPPKIDTIMPRTEIDASKAGLKLYPNPIESELRVVSEKYAISRLAIYSSVSGELVFLCPIPAPQGACIIINMSSCSGGNYVVRVWFKDMKKPVSCNVYKT
ncbi:MAG: hypothetical protein LBO71_01785 [Prevotellaceae bacterium]|nr:hypothetical protein [Prevotellaceae bacterium]